MNNVLPTRPREIDDTNRGDHSFLSPEDACYYYGEFFAGKGWSGGDTNQLIKNFKIKPTELAAKPQRQYYKNKALNEIAETLNGSISAAYVRELITFVPVPPSKTPAHPDYCDRLTRVLAQAFVGLGADIRPLVRQVADLDADHASSGSRSTYQELLSVTEVDRDALRTPLRQIVMLFDDVLTSGKHFKVCKQRILEAVPGARIQGLFIARVIHQTADCEFGPIQN